MRDNKARNTNDYFSILTLAFSFLGFVESNMCTNYTKVNRNKYSLESLASLLLLVLLSLVEQIEIKLKTWVNKRLPLPAVSTINVSVCVCSSITKRKTTVIFRRCYNLCENASFLVFLVCQQDIGTDITSSFKS